MAREDWDAVIAKFEKFKGVPIPHVLMPYKGDLETAIRRCKTLQTKNPWMSLLGLLVAYKLR